MDRITGIVIVTLGFFVWALCDKAIEKAVDTTFGATFETPEGIKASVNVAVKPGASLSAKDGGTSGG